MQHCCGIPSALAPNDIRHLIAWSSGVRSFSLEMSDMRTAVDSLTHLLTGAEAPTRSVSWMKMARRGNMITFKSYGLPQLIILVTFAGRPIAADGRPRALVGPPDV